MSNKQGLSSREEVYDRATIILHWLTAILVVLQWSGAILIGLVDERPVRMIYWTVHIGLGTMLFIAILVRLVWRRMGGRILPAIGNEMLQKVVRDTHRLLYVLLAVLMTLGFGIIALRGWRLIGLFTIMPVLPGHQAFSSKLVQMHLWTAHLLIAVAFSHAIVALYHHLVLKDGVLRRMMIY
ncbi:MAG: cytochrome b/b6 domain-containing protein [Alphaproteobacteria bacterium]|nr:cytochrome b/b6 domain-containing protein [Alphaproteobacteria bacterium]MDE2110096.1 cytochrome b/b6 domain-containing protein [Alphaproteobacteria bacterium]MDE2495122.1 cytochrome b/b6 domain-containing protein [Alphaproteobacteria bacterium]